MAMDYDLLVEALQADSARAGLRPSTSPSIASIAARSDRDLARAPLSGEAMSVVSQAPRKRAARWYLAQPYGVVAPFHRALGLHSSAVIPAKAGIQGPKRSSGGGEAHRSRMRFTHSSGGAVSVATRTSGDSGAS